MSSRSILRNQYSISKHLFTAISSFIVLDLAFKNRPIYITGESYAGLLGFSPFNTIIYKTKEIALWVLKRFLSPILGYREFEAFVSVGGLEYEEPQVGFVANIRFEDL
ncbi:unnamed protein product [Citrullus colocynthis]|uniref:Carboxypeptidase n=1 Tax=Citrullus colocynthis TaxID=252529 RepID=A0ABP0ZFY6_9ROSI